MRPENALQVCDWIEYMNSYTPVESSWFQKPEIFMLVFVHVNLILSFNHFLFFMLLQLCYLGVELCHTQVEMFVEKLNDFLYKVKLIMTVFAWEV